jgi:hypothetical protein
LGKQNKLIIQENISQDIESMNDEERSIANIIQKIRAA